ncbi:uncharacterized protein FIBRA_07512 [Fibroporia radiculosa]|uniref:Uncharacterized protein n=1 Tax=Fibroporia radiculosa TaxID=599839 RepID=J4GEQ0_9APHY|nr:uncharacterized protein FIBRA_07512 [Fibroporia radiculosa]CCM05298.1 predicted protein [Fibroporia radiculosa]
MFMVTTSRLILVAFTFFNVLGNVAISASSTNLLIRALALWKHKQGIRATLLLMSITQWIIGLIFGILSSGVESEHESQCGGVFPNSHKELTIFFFYSVVHDSCILIFTIVALASKSDAAILANVPVAILAWFNLNPIMDLMFAVSGKWLACVGRANLVMTTDCKCDRFVGSCYLLDGIGKGRKELNMIDWESEEILHLLTSLYLRLLTFFLGFYGWQYLLTLHHVELPLVTGKLKFRLIYIPYLVGRHALLVLTTAGRALEFLLSASALYCYLPYLFGKLSLIALNSATVSASSTNLLARTLVLWRHKRIVQVSLILMNAAHWLVGLTLGPMSIRPANANVKPLCGPLYPNTFHEYTIFFSYTVFCDTTILVATVVGLGLRADDAGTRLWDKIHDQGFWYLCTTVVVNLPVLIFSTLNSNPFMALLFVVVARIVSVIVSSATVISLMEMRNGGDSDPDGEVYQTSKSEGPSEEGPLTTYIDVDLST